MYIASTVSIILKLKFSNTNQALLYVINCSFTSV